MYWRSRSILPPPAPVRNAWMSCTGCVMTGLCMPTRSRG
tara:strand:+ start:107050 stop:107166 length:117 start_codon:yes stop_codon:yes gene_type:complete